MDYKFIFLLGAFVLVLCLYVRNIIAVKKISRELEKRVREESSSYLPMYSNDLGFVELIDSINSLISQINSRMEILDESFGEVGETLVNISHDLRTPLTSAKGYVELVLSGEISNEDREMLNIAHQRLEVLSGLLEQLFVYTKVHDERYELHPEDIDISEFAVEIFAGHYHEFELKNIELVLDVEENVHVYQDVKAMEQVFNNVIQNALRYGKDYMKIRICSCESSAFMVFENPTDQNISDAEVLKKSYVTGDGHRPEGSSGLGLSIIGFYIERMGGEYSVKVKDGVFSIEFKLK